jgi:hypothetical protein
MYNPYIQETVAKLRFDDLLREAQHAREVELASSGQGVRPGAIMQAQRRFGRWLAAWGITFQAVQIDKDRPATITGRCGD